MSRSMPLLTELGGCEMDSCYKHVATYGASALQRRCSSVTDP